MNFANAGLWDIAARYCAYWLLTGGGEVYYTLLDEIGISGSVDFPPEWQGVAAELLNPEHRRDGVIMDAMLYRSLGQNDRARLLDLKREIEDAGADYGKQEYSQVIWDLKTCARTARFLGVAENLKRGEIAVTQAEAVVLNEVEGAESDHIYHMPEAVGLARQRNQDIITGKAELVYDCGFTALNARLFLKPGSTTGLIGETKAGKSALVQVMSTYVARDLARRGAAGCVYYVSQEMPVVDLVERWACMIARVDLLARHEWDEKQRLRYDKALDELEALPIVVEDRNGVRASEIADVMKTMNRKYGGVKVVINDYRGLGALNAESSKLDATNRIKALSAEFVAVVRNHDNPDGSKAAGVLIAEVKKDEAHPLPSDKALMYGGQYGFHSLFAVFDFRRYLDPVNPGFDDVTEYIEYLRERIGYEPIDNERWIMLLNARYGRNVTGRINAYFTYTEHHTLWEQIERAKG